MSTLTADSLYLPCADCSQPLPIRIAWPNEQPRTWYCADCGAECVGIIDHQAPNEIKTHIRGAAITFPANLAIPPRDVNEFLEGLSYPESRIIEKRFAPRHPMAAIVPTQPVDDQFRPIGQPFMATARNLSKIGMSVIHLQPVQAPFAILELRSPLREPVQLVMRISRCRQLGPYFDVAGDFVMKLNRVT